MRRLAGEAGAQKAPPKGRTPNPEALRLPDVQLSEMRERWVQWLPLMHAGGIEPIVEVLRIAGLGWARFCEHLLNWLVLHKCVFYMFLYGYDHFHNRSCPAFG